MEYKEMIDKFNKHLSNTKDSPEGSYVFIHFFRMLLLSNHGQNLPLLEMLTIIKYERPQIYYSMRQRSQHYLGMLFDLSMTKEVAEERLKTLSKAD